MERRLIAAMLLSMLVLFAYNLYVAHQRQKYLEEHPEYAEQLEREAKEAQQRAEEGPAEIQDSTPSLEPSVPSTREATPAVEFMPLVEQEPTNKIITVRSPLYEVEIAAQGGRPISWKLLDYQEQLEKPSLLENYQKKMAAETVGGGDAEWVERQRTSLKRMRLFLERKLSFTRQQLAEQEQNPCEPLDSDRWPPRCAVEVVPTLWEGTEPLSLRLGDRVIDKFIPYQSEVDHLEVEYNGQLILTGRYGQFEIVKTYLFDPEKYVLNYSVTIRNLSEEEIEFEEDERFHLTWDDGVGLDLFNDAWNPPVLFQVSNSIEKESGLAKLIRQNKPSSIDWALLQNKYFTACIEPRVPLQADPLTRRPEWDHGSLDLYLNLARLEPGDSHTEEFDIYIGPKDPQYLSQLDSSIKDILFMGWFRKLAKPFGLFFLQVLRVIQMVTINWGLAIIALTVLTKFAMYPIMRKQMQSMKNMQRIAPLQKEIQEKYKNNQQKMQKEMMSLYKREKVNPAGGCLPILLTMPIFIALYIVIYIAPELRGAPFILWIRDLSQPDTLFSFYFAPMNWVVRFNVLPILNGVYQYYAQKKQIVDPKQAGMMQMMPVIFVFIFWNFPSGLVLYWICQAVLGTVQQGIFNRLHEKEKEKKKGKNPLAARAAQRAKGRK